MTGERTAKSNGSDASKSSNVGSQRGRILNSKEQMVRKSNRVIQDTVYLVRKKVKAFKKEHLGARSKFNLVACSKCLEEDILTQWNIPADKVKDYEEFLQLTLRKELDDEIASSDEYIDLISIGNRARAFASLISDAKPRMLKCLHDQVYTNCGSLKEMVGKELMLSVSEYDANVCQYKLNTEDKMDELVQNYTSYRQLTKPFLKFVKGGDEHAVTMNKVCNNLLELCKLVENWISEDNKYPSKLVEEFECNKKIRDNLKDSLLQVQEKKGENTDEIEKLKRSETRAFVCYTEQRKNKLKLKSRQTELENKRKILQDKIATKREEHEDLKKAEREKSPRSPRESSSIQEKLGLLETSIAKMELEKKTTERQLKKLEKDMKPVNERTYEHKVDAVTFRHQKEEVEKSNKKLEVEMNAIKKRINNIDANNEMLMKIREMKLSPDVYRKSMRDKQKRDVSLSDGSKDLSDACRFVAPYIGKDWQKVYMTLPFDPPRDALKRHQDVNILDYIAARNDITWSDQALKSLDKWRSFHRRGNVQDLVQTLRCVRKGQIANELEDKFITATT